MILLSSCCGVWLCLSSYCSIYLFVGNLDRQNISDQRQQIKSIVVSMIQNWNYRYSCYNSNIKYVDSTIEKAR